jgi:hypothetical protein
MTGTTIEIAYGEDGKYEIRGLGKEHLQTIYEWLEESNERPAECHSAQEIMRAIEQADKEFVREGSEEDRIL